VTEGNKRLKQCDQILRKTEQRMKEQQSLIKRLVPWSSNSVIIRRHIKSRIYDNVSLPIFKTNTLPVFFGQLGTPYTRAMTNCLRAFLQKAKTNRWFSVDDLRIEGWGATTVCISLKCFRSICTSSEFSRWNVPSCVRPSDIPLYWIVCEQRGTKPWIKSRSWMGEFRSVIVSRVDNYRL